MEQGIFEQKFQKYELFFKFRLNILCGLAAEEGCRDGLRVRGSSFAWTSRPCARKAKGSPLGNPSADRLFVDEGCRGGLCESGPSFTWTSSSCNHGQVIPFKITPHPGRSSHPLL